jgi:hypothetical protein
MWAVAVSSNASDGEDFGFTMLTVVVKLQLLRILILQCSCGEWKLPVVKQATALSIFDILLFFNGLRYCYSFEQLHMTSYNILGLPTDYGYAL